MRKRISSILFLTLAVLFVCTACGPKAVPKSFDSFVFEAESISPYGADRNTAFILYTDTAYDTAALTKMISFEPAVDFAVENPGEGRYRLAPKTPLERDTQYTVTLHTEGAQDRTFTFRTYGDFRLVGSRSYNQVLTLSFTAPPAQDLPDHLAIEPELPGSWEFRENQALFLVSDEAYDLYPDLHDREFTVTGDGELQSAYGEPLAEPLSESFTLGSRNNSNPFWLMGDFGPASNGYLETFTPEQVPYAMFGRIYEEGFFGADNPEGMTPVTVTVHRVTSSQDYLYYLERIAQEEQQAAEDLELLTEEEQNRVLSFETEIPLAYDYSTASSMGNRTCLSLPEALPEGHYVMEMEVRHRGVTYPLYKLLQVSPITYYHSTVNDSDTVLWLNDAVTGEPVANGDFTIRAGGTAVEPLNGRTGEDGLFRGSQKVHPESGNDSRWFRGARFLTVRKDGRTFHDFLGYYSLDGEQLRNSCYTALYTDRTLYRPSDVIQVWGCVYPREGRTLPEEELLLVLSRYEEGVLHQEPVHPAKDGTFTASISVEDLGYGGVDLSLLPASAIRMDENGGVEQVETYRGEGRWLTIEDFDTPDYTYTASFDKEFYTPADKAVGFDMNVTFFDGTPMKNKRVLATAGDNYYYGKGELPAGTITAATDEKGQLRMEFPMEKIRRENEEYASSWPLDYPVRVQNLEAEDMSFLFSGRAPVFLRDVRLETEYQRGEETDALRIQLNALDFSRLEHYDQWREQGYDAIRGRGLSQPVELTVTATETIRTQTGTYYDPYEQKQVPAYEYSYEDRQVMQKTLTTGADGSLVIPDLPRPDRDTTYNYLLRTKDSSGAPVEERLWAYPPYPRFGDRYLYSFDSDGYSFDETDTVEARVILGDEDLSRKPESRYLYLTVSSGAVTHAEISSEPRTTVAIGRDSRELLPNFLLTGACFDGSQIHSIRDAEFQLDTDSVRLAVDAKTEPEICKPGEEVRVELTVTDVDGKPVKGAAVAVSPVDAAVEALQGSWPYDLADQLYRYSWIDYQAVTSNRHVSNEEGGKGGGGGDMETGGGEVIRDTFRLSLDLATAVTDGSGKAVFTYTMPDNLTRWNYQVLALAPNRHAGSAKISGRTSLPFFVNPIAAETYLTGDEIGIAVRSFGEKIEDGTPVRYTLTVKDTDHKYTADGTVNGSDTINLGQLPAGEYTAVLTAVCGEHQDGMEFPFRVVETRSMIPVRSWVDLTAGEKLPEAMASPVGVTVYSTDYEPVFRALSLLQYAQDQRTDTMLAKEMIGGALTEYLGIEDPGEDFDGRATGLQRLNTGGKGSGSLLTLFPGDENPSLSLTARALAVQAPGVAQWVDRWDNLPYFSVWEMEGALQFSESPDVIADQLLFLLSSGQENYVNNILDGQYTLEELAEGLLQKKELSPVGRAHLVTALAAADPDLADQYYERELLPLLSRPDVRIPLGHHNEVDTASALLLASMATDHTEQLDEMVLWITEEQNKLENRGECTLELALYLRDFEPQLKDGRPSITCVQKSGEKKLDLDRDKSYSMTLTREEYQALSFRDAKGKISAEVRYMGRPEENGFVKSPDITFTRRVDNPNPKVGDIVTVTLTASFKEAPKYSWYQVTDFVPSNMRLLPPDSIYTFYGSADYNTTNGRFTAYLGGDQTTYTITYKMQKVVDADAVFDAAYLYNQHTAEGSLIERLPSPLPGEEQKSVPLLGQPFRNEYICGLARDLIRQTIRPGMDDVQRIRALYEASIRKNAFLPPVAPTIWQYRGDPLAVPTYEEQRALSPLLWGIGTCEDYASEMVVLLRMLGYDARYVFGMTLSVEGEFIDHAWLVVRLGDRWYHLDPQLEDNIIRGGQLRYRYFLVDDAAMLPDHRWGESLIRLRPELTEDQKQLLRTQLRVPACTGSVQRPQPITVRQLPTPDPAGALRELEREQSRYQELYGTLPPAVELNFEPPMEIWDP